MGLVFIFLSVLLARWGSAWIEGLYWRHRDLLSFPVAGEPRWRQPFLAGAFTLLGIMLAGRGLPWGELAGGLMLGLFLLLTMVTDWEQQLVFDRMQLPFGLLGLAFSLGRGQLPEHLLAAVAGGVVFLLLSLVTKGALGGGDIKLIFVLGLWLGPENLLQICLGGMLLGGVTAGIMLLSGRWQRDTHFAYSPYFSLVALLILLIK